MRFIEKFRVGRFLKTMWVAYRQFRLQILFITILSFFNGIFEGLGIVAIIPLLSFVDGDITGGSQDFVSTAIREFFTNTGLYFSLRNLLIMLTLLFIVKALLMYWNVTLGARIAYQYDTSTRHRLYRKTLSARWSFMSNQKLGYLEQVLVTDVNYASNILASISATTIICVNLFIYSLIVVNLSLPVALATVVFGAGLFLLIKPILYKNKVVSDESALMFKKLAHQVNESVVGMKVIRSLAVEEPLANRVGGFFERMGQLKIKNLVFRNVSNIMLPPLGFIFVLLMFAYMFKTGQFSVATFAVVVYAINKVFANVQLFQSQLHAMTSMLPHLTSVMHYEKTLIENQDSKSGISPFVFMKELRFNNINFVYPDRPILLNDVSLSIGMGQILGITGPSGSGKTTMVDLLLRLLEPSAGSITIDQVSISEINVGEWRKYVGYVSQEPFLINGTIAENIKFFDSNICDEDVRKFSKEAGISDFVEGLPSGYDTLVGDRGVLLSGGQRQRIALARVLARKPKVLILDEATSSLDAESEAKIQSAIERLKGHITVIIIAHRPSTFLLADKIVTIEGGKIIESGSPSELLSIAGSYLSRIVNIAKPN